jgi:hypothetical protein
MTMRWYLKLSCALVAAAVISLASIAGTLLWVAARPTSPVPLTEGMTGHSWAQASAEFDHRLKTRFPAGSSEDALIAELRREGFAQSDWRHDVAQEHQAWRTEQNLVCNMAAIAYWRADAAGVLTAIRGVYRETGCL